MLLPFGPWLVLLTFFISTGFFLFALVRSASTVAKLVALGIFLVVLGAAGRGVYVFLHPGVLNGLGGQPPTTCTAATAKQDCSKLKCVNPSSVFYCDHTGEARCYQDRCGCFYGCW